MNPIDHHRTRNRRFENVLVAKVPERATRLFINEAPRHLQLGDPAGEAKTNTEVVCRPRDVLPKADQPVPDARNGSFVSARLGLGVHANIARAVEHLAR